MTKLIIGSPQVNLLPVTFDGQHLVNGNLKLSGFSDLPGSKELVLGIRPDDLTLDNKTI